MRKLAVFEAERSFGVAHFQQNPAGCGADIRSATSDEEKHPRFMILKLVGGLEHDLYFSIYWE